MVKCLVVEVAAARLDTGTGIESRLLAFDLQPDQNQSDSGCAGLLDEEEEDDTNSQGVYQKERTLLPRPSAPGPQGVVRSHPSPSGGQVSISKSQRKRLLHVDGPIDGSPYAVLVKQRQQRPYYADSGYSVNVSTIYFLQKFEGVCRAVPS